jgi:mercuric reductase
MKQTHYDLVILGSGSTAFAAALRAQELGKTSVMTEERTTGGTCVNRDCLPSKNLIEAAKIIHDARNQRYPGLTPAQIGLDFRKLIEQKDDVIHGYRKKKYESLTGGQNSRPSNYRVWGTATSRSRRSRRKMKEESHQRPPAGT